MAMSYVMDLSGPRLGAPPFRQWLKNFLNKVLPIPPAKKLNGPWYSALDRFDAEHATIVPTSQAMPIARGSGINGLGDLVEYGSIIPFPPPPPPVKTRVLRGLGGITDAISNNPIALVGGIALGVWLASRK